MFTPKPSNDAPTWATKFCQDIVRWVEGLNSGPQRLTAYTVLTLPSPSQYSRTMIYVSNETGGAVPAFSDGTNWRRVTDRVIVS